MSDTDLQLLARYARDRAEDAFAEIVRRHLDLVHSAALRQVRSPQLAEEVAQSVFTDLARNSRRLAPDTILTAWLYQVTRRTAIDVVRREARRQLREQIATEMNAMNATTADWTHIEPLLDEAMHALDETDRAAVLLRYFENKSLREVGATLGTSDDAAQKRVSRAVERLREFFTKRGVTVGAGGLAIVISANAVQAAPAGLAITISAAAALAGTTIATTATATKAIAMTTLQKTLIATTLAVVAGSGIYEAHQASNLGVQVQTLQQQQAPLAEQIQQLQRERDEARRSLLALADAINALKGNSSELLKLRGEVARLRGEANAANDPFVQQALTWKAKLVKLVKLFEDRPEQRIPELALVNDDQWFSIAKDSDLDTESGIRNALSSLRSIAEQNFASMAQVAVAKFAQANDKQFPTELSQLQSYFDSPVDDAILQRWKILPAGATIPGIGGEGPLITEKAAVDELFDRRYGVMTSGYGVTDFLSSEIQDIITPVYQAYNAANNETSHYDPSQLLPYATTPEQQAAVQKLIQQYAAKKIDH